jgi:hypothetical protein
VIQNILCCCSCYWCLRYLYTLRHISLLTFSNMISFRPSETNVTSDSVYRLESFPTSDILAFQEQIFDGGGSQLSSPI